MEFSLRHRASVENPPDAPLVYFVHGRAGNRDVMWTFRRAVPPTWNVIAPEAPLDDPIGGYSWWLIGEGKGKWADVEGAADKFTRFAEEAEAGYKLTPKIRIALGFSQGSGLLSVVFQTGKMAFDGVGILAGFTIEVRPEKRKAIQLPKVFIAHGTNDETVSIAMAKEGRDFLTSIGAEVTFIEDPVGHKIGTQAMRGLKIWLETFR